MNDFRRGVARLHELHAHIARIALSARMDLDYQRGGRCIPGFSLPATLDDPDVRFILNDNQLDTLILTAYDGMGFADCVTPTYLVPALYTPENTARMVKEYEEFVYRLRSLTQTNSKQVILSNWEADNAVCGSAYQYAFADEFRKRCDVQYPIAYAGNARPEDSLRGLILWMTVRYAGATLGNARADAEGLSSRRVLVAPEFSAVRMLKAKGFKSVLQDVIPNVPFDCLSYSSYESLNTTDPATSLKADLDLIRDITGTNRVILGEVGFSRANAKAQLVPRTRMVIDAAMDWGVVYIIQWNLTDGDAQADFGAFDSTGAITELGEFYRSVLQ